MTHIRDILHRRTDLSTFVVHLTRATDSASAIEVLAEIASSHVLKAGRAFGWARDHDDPAEQSHRSQRCVCFSETPLEHINLLLGSIEPAREIVMEPYGLALPKMLARRSAINPVWYVDMSPGRDWILRDALDALVASTVETAKNSGRPFGDYYLARITPFIDHMGTWPSTGGQKEFWWEREWRHVGDMVVPEPGVIWLCPENKIDDLRDLSGRPIDPWIDPRWGLERIIAHLAKIPRAHITPFT